MNRGLLVANIQNSTKGVTSFILGHSVTRRVKCNHLKNYIDRRQSNYLTDVTTYNKQELKYTP
jgi:hypothetical protein